MCCGVLLLTSVSLHRACSRDVVAEDTCAERKMSDRWMFGLSDEARRSIYEQRDRKALLERLESLETKVDALIESMSAVIQCEEDPRGSNKKC